MFKARERPIRKAETKKKKESRQQFQNSFFHQDYWYGSWMSQESETLEGDERRRKTERRQL